MNFSSAQTKKAQIHNWILRIGMETHSERPSDESLPN